jgi:hypothetical protein
VAENTDERAGDGTSTKPPRRSVDEAQPDFNGGVFIEGTDKWLTFDLSGVPKARPLERRVSHLMTRRTWAKNAQTVEFGRAFSGVQLRHKLRPASARCQSA